MFVRFSNVEEADEIMVKLGLDAINLDLLGGVIPHLHMACLLGVGNARHTLMIHLAAAIVHDHLQPELSVASFLGDQVPN
eukprot:CAMPEP_0204426662 /NCGR_PEP_ID=MMETSP0470-20130426/52808_1 /ASSEMBLY_ACC=CAM_ASM_000385 /TAXON_ID=2969 /ORGANISM="Oxyrrhis marina" /LENGTH=79 /DNA_ID=CAMNT_0051424381 /DNA_START=60 /DNA_END=299 /DNA_ORIENTATION=-